jgi:hypothetical protein
MAEICQPTTPGISRQSRFLNHFFLSSYSFFPCPRFQEEAHWKTPYIAVGIPKVNIYLANTTQREEKAKVSTRMLHLPNPGKNTSKTLQLRIFRRLGVIEDVTFGEVLVSPGKVCSQVTKMPLQRFSPASGGTRFL